MKIMKTLIEDFSDDDFDDDGEPTQAETLAKYTELEARCKASDIPFESMDGFEDGDVAARFALQAGREKRWIHCWDFADFDSILKIKFEEYTFINGLDTICKYNEGSIEALVRPLTGAPNPRIGYSRLFGFSHLNFNDEWPSAELNLKSIGSGPETSIILSKTTNEMNALTDNAGAHTLSLKIKREGIAQHDQAETLLRNLSDALFFQIDLLKDIPLTLGRQRRAGMQRKAKNKSRDDKLILEYPRTDFDSAPISLYWYARSAIGMPLLQYLAYYQVIEYYYPTYSQAEARRRLKNILKDPTFRGDRDADIGKVLSAILVTRSGAFGDERSQLKSTLTECIDPDALLEFIKSDVSRSAFLSSKTKGLTDHKLPIETKNIDLRNDVAERIYEIRCKIVHTKTDSRTGDLELLLPFSKEAEQLQFDIELVQYIAQQVLVAASATT